MAQGPIGRILMTRRADEDMRRTLVYAYKCWERGWCDDRVGDCGGNNAYKVGERCNCGAFVVEVRWA